MTQLLQRIAVPFGGSNRIPLPSLTVTIATVTLMSISPQVFAQEGFAPSTKWIAAEADGHRFPRGREGVSIGTDSVQPLPIFRREFGLTQGVKRAEVLVTGLGHYELHVNGQNVTDTVLNPGWTNYEKTVLYNRFDVTKLLRQGPNALGVMLGNGMYHVPNAPGRYTKFTGSFGQPKFILELHIELEDGTKQVISSDTHWGAASGPIVFSSIYGGEDYDARRELPKWDLPGGDSEKWAPVHVVDGPGGKLALATNPPMKPLHTYPALSSQTKSPSQTVYDLGQNFSGWPVIRVSGPAGAMVKILPGELLDDKGFVTQRSVGGGPGYQNEFNYTLKGSGVETWRPQFSYHGFRYLQLVTAPGVKVHAVAGEFVHADAPVVGRFESSSDLFNRIHRLIVMAMQSNTASVLTDCPTREKLGWLEQTHLAGSSLMYNFDLSKLYEKVASDMADSQLDTGLVPAIAPEFVAFVHSNGVSTDFRDSPEWGSASILSPWRAYQFSGDRGILESAYPTMTRYAAYLKGRSIDHLLMYGLGDWYDIGPGAPGYSQLTGQGFTPTAIYLEDLSVLAKVSSLLGKAEAAKAFEIEREAVKAAFNARFFHADAHRYDRGSQTANAMALVLDLVPDGERSLVLESLVADIRAHHDHVTAGDVGFHYVVRALTDGGRSDVLYDMLSRTDSPSYGYQLARGATTLTEAWDTNPESSQNHFMLGHADEWFYRGLAGIDFDRSRGDAQAILIRPAFLPGLNHVRADFRSSLGLIKSSWSRSGGKLTLELTIPKGAVATVFLPGKDAKPQPISAGRHVFTVTEP